jgi:hypothetical protein
MPWIAISIPVVWTLTWCILVHFYIKGRIKEHFQRWPTLQFKVDKGEIALMFVFLPIVVIAVTFTYMLKLPELYINKQVERALIKQNKFIDQVCAQAGHKP